MIWTTKRTLNFLQVLQTEPLIWNPKLSNHRNRGDVKVAWKRVHKQLEYNCTVDHLKRKRERLMASFRKLWKKKKIDDKFQPNWFAYNQMEEFLGPVYQCIAIKKAETENSLRLKCGDVDINSDNNSERCVRETNEESVDEERLSPLVATERLTLEKEKPNGSLKRKRYDEAQQVESDVKDECELYGQLLARKLQNFAELDRDELMLEIDSLVLERKRRLGLVSVIERSDTPISATSSNYITHEVNIKTSPRY